MSNADIMPRGCLWLLSYFELSLSALLFLHKDFNLFYPLTLWGRLRSHKLHLKLLKLCNYAKSWCLKLSQLGCTGRLMERRLLLTTQVRIVCSLSLYHGFLFIFTITITHKTLGLISCFLSLNYDKINTQRSWPTVLKKEEGVVMGSWVRTRADVVFMSSWTCRHYVYIRMWFFQLSW